MKVQWEESDIACGRRYFHPTANETWIIGYLSYGSDPIKYTSVSLIDGMVTPPKTKAELAEALTASGYIPFELEKYARK